MKQTMIETERGAFAVRVEGDEAAPLAVLLHGFPDDASTFDGLSAHLATQGYRTLAPYLRGYAPSPRDGDLSLDGLTADLLAIVQAASPDRPISFVGHDYGAQIGYVAVTKAPERFARAVTLAGAHPAIINRNLKRLPRQWWMSRYIVLFQLGALADRRVAANDFRYIETLWRRWSPGFTPPRDHIARIKETFAASMPAPIAMYRAGGFDVPARPVQVPLLSINGDTDGCLLPATAAGQRELFPAGYREMSLEGVGHFPHLERPELVAAAITDHLTSA